MPVFRVPAAITYPQNGSPGVNVWSVRTDDTFPPIDGLDAAISALAQFYTSLNGRMCVGMKVTLGPDIVDRETLIDQSRPPTEVPAVGVTSSAAPALQMCISWRTELRARRAMGRTFFGPLSTPTVDTNGTPTSVAFQQVSDAAQALIDASDTANGWAIGVWGLQDPGVYDEQGRLVPGQPHVHRDITTFKVRDQFAVLRSRRD